MFTLSPAHTDLSTCDVSYARWHDILHIDPTLLLFLENREIVYKYTSERKCERGLWMKDDKPAFITSMN